MHRAAWLALVAVLPAFAWSAEPETVTAERRDVALERRFEATLEAVRRATVAAEVSGTVEEVLFDVDDVVPAGAVLVRFSDTEPRARVDAAQGELAEARARLAQAEQEFARVSEIYDRKLVAKSALDAATAARDSTRARVAAARARLAEAEARLDKTVVRAPYSGIVTARHVEVGETAQPGTPLMSGLSLEHLRVAGVVPQGLVPKLREGPRAEIRLPGREPLALEALTIFPYADPASHTVTVRADLPPERTGGLFPGMHAKLVVEVGEVSRLLVPESAVVRRGELTALYVVGGAGRIGLRQVRLGDARDGWREVLAGLEEGERVAVDPVAAGVALKDQAGRRGQ